MSNHENTPLDTSRRSVLAQLGLAGAAGLVSATTAGASDTLPASRSDTRKKSSASSMDFQTEKNLVRAHHGALALATPQTVAEVLAERTSSDWHWRGMHPFHEQYGATAVASVFWQPFLESMTRVQRRPDIFMAGLNEIDGFKSTWVVSVGHLMALFDHAYLGIRPTNRIVMLRYAEFNRVERDKIVETAFYCDIPDLMIQAGQNPFPPQTGAYLVQPGPATHEGLMYQFQDPATGQATLAAINGMLNDMGTKDHTKEERLGRTWNSDMIWWGPGSIGATYTISRYITQHANPFTEALNEGYRFNGHLCKIAEGHFGGFFGWPNLTVANSGGYLGMTASPHPADMRVVDIYREQGGKLSENWVFIDILHFLNQQGLDILARMQSLQPST